MTIADPRDILLQELLSGPGYGRDLARRIREKANGAATLNFGSLYPTLRSMEREGLVESYQGETAEARAGRPRIYYKITKAGRELAQNERQMAVLRGLVPVGT